MYIAARESAAALSSRKADVISLQIVSVGIALAVFVLRIYTRARLLRSVGSDDYIMGVAMLFSIAMSVNACLSTKYGWGLHIYQIPPVDYTPVLICVWLSEILFTVAAGFVKLSILVFYLRLANTKTYRRVVYGSIALIIAWAITFTTMSIFQCTPVSDYWNPESSASNCINPEVAYLLHGLMSTLTDVFVYVLPMRMVWKIQLPKRQRLGLIFVFGIGFVVCVAASLRLYYSIRTNRSSDPTWVGVNLWTWEAVELNLGIVCASVPCLKALIIRIIPKLMSTNNESIKTGESRPHPRTGRSLLGFQSKDIEGAYSLRSVVTTGIGGRRDKGKGESQEDLTDGRIYKHTVIVSSTER